MKALVLYYSYSGNAEGIAQRIQQRLDCDIQEIVPVTPYSEDFDTVVDQSEQKVKDGFEPEIRPFEHNPADYDVIVLGTPVWWYTFASPTKSALSSIDWTGKRLYAFATNAGWLANTLQDIENSCTGADVRPGLNLRFDEDRLLTSEAEIDRWISGISDK